MFILTGSPPWCTLKLQPVSHARKPLWRQRSQLRWREFCTLIYQTARAVATVARTYAHTRVTAAGQR